LQRQIVSNCPWPQAKIPNHVRLESRLVCRRRRGAQVPDLNG
jgi:hypothetical protein